MQIRNVVTGEIGQHTKMFPQISFPESGPTDEWLALSDCESYETPPYIPTTEELAEQNRQQILWQILQLQNKCLRCLVEDTPDTTWLDIYKADIATLRAQL